ncbi:TatD family hydrolase [uncultured Muribaculum sp.]|uniref:TatD family hydrolase n=1 Tax=uncultured Muribaculum sp. TaxID=1918613 RepID=UPI0025D3A5B5|nr:TatD family hydrolase [uncultured Muribaculum sp.]
MLVDTHTHIYLQEEFPDAGDVLRRAADAGVGHMVLPNVDLASLSPLLAMHARYPEQTSVALGLHPTEVGSDFKSALAVVKKHIDESPEGLVAIGEIGIDLYWDSSYRQEQREAFAMQCDWAVEKDLPVIIHCREGLDDTLDILSSMPKAPRGVFHSFGGTCEDVDRIREIGDYYFGINGIVTFKNSKLRDVLPHIGIERILLETDSPYLAPVPYRGRRNESAYVAYVAAVTAQALGMSVEETGARTTGNAAALFSLPVIK